MLIQKKNSWPRDYCGTWQSFVFTNLSTSKLSELFQTFAPIYILHAFIYSALIEISLSLKIVVTPCCNISYCFYYHKRYSFENVCFFMIFNLIFIFYHHTRWARHDPAGVTWSPMLTNTKSKCHLDIPN